MRHQIPGGMRSNLEFQLAQLNAETHLPEVLKEVVAVRRDLGYPRWGHLFLKCAAPRLR